jgi:8-oxo-dGTP pyrophosphatase MutT (NUDIX family)
MGVRPGKPAGKSERKPETAPLNTEEAPFDAPSGERPARLRPRDAATLILVRDGREVLMGQRAGGHAFMPDKWVFPGGAVDRGDARAPAASELRPEVALQLRHGGVRRAPRAFALAAARETMEETGLALGGPSGPDMARLSLVCRAITPPYRPRRFDARFFLADSALVLADDAPKAGAELVHTAWVGLEEVEKLDLPAITRFVLGEVRARLAGEARGVAFLRWVRGGHQLERI